MYSILFYSTKQSIYAIKQCSQLKPAHKMCFTSRDAIMGIEYGLCCFMRNSIISRLFDLALVHHNICKSRIWQKRTLDCFPITSVHWKFLSDGNIWKCNYISGHHITILMSWYEQKWFACVCGYIRIRYMCWIRHEVAKKYQIHIFKPIARVRETARLVYVLRHFLTLPYHYKTAAICFDAQICR